MCLFWAYSAPCPPSQTLLQACRMTWSSLPWTIVHVQSSGQTALPSSPGGVASSPAACLGFRHHVSRKAFPHSKGPAQVLLLSSGGMVSRLHHSRLTTHCICSFSHTLPTDHTFTWGRSSLLIVYCLLVCLLFVAWHVTGVQQMFAESWE